MASNATCFQQLFFLPFYKYLMRYLRIFHAYSFYQTAAHRQLPRHFEQLVFYRTTAAVYYKDVHCVEIFFELFKPGLTS